MKIIPILQLIGSHAITPEDALTVRKEVHGALEKGEDFTLDFTGVTLFGCFTAFLFWESIQGTKESLDLSEAGTFPLGEISLTEDPNEILRHLTVTGSEYAQGNIQRFLDRAKERLENPVENETSAEIAELLSNIQAAPELDDEIRIMAGCMDLLYKMIPEENRELALTRIEDSFGHEINQWIQNQGD